MTEDLIQLIGNYGVVGLLAYFGMKEFFVYLSKNNGKNNKKGIEEKDSIQDIDIAVLKNQMMIVLTNDLPHIEKSLDENKAEHKETQAMLFKIMSKLNKR